MSSSDDARSAIGRMVYDADFPDPQAIKAGDTYVAYSTNGEAGNVPVLTSPDLADWTPAGDAMPELPAWADPGRTWAPEVLALAPDRFVLYFTAADRKSGRQCIGRAVSADPTGPFVDDTDGPLVCQADEGGSIDASPFRDADGTLYLYWKNDGNCCGQSTYIYAQRLADDGLSLTGKPVQLFREEELWEGNLVEAPFMWLRDGVYTMFFSANAFDSEYYAIGYATCEGPLGPCTKSPDNPILASFGQAAGPGHCSLVEHDGATVMLFHAWAPDSIGSVFAGRTLWSAEVTWSADGRPHLAGG